MTYQREHCLERSLLIPRRKRAAASSVATHLFSTQPAAQGTPLLSSLHWLPSSLTRKTHVLSPKPSHRGPNDLCPGLPRLRHPPGSWTDEAGPLPGVLGSWLSTGPPPPPQVPLYTSLSQGGPEVRVTPITGTSLSGIPEVATVELS